MLSSVSSKDIPKSSVAPSTPSTAPVLKASGPKKGPKKESKEPLSRDEIKQARKEKKEWQQQKKLQQQKKKEEQKALAETKKIAKEQEKKQKEDRESEFLEFLATKSVTTDSVKSVENIFAADAFFPSEASEFKYTDTSTFIVDKLKKANVTADEKDERKEPIFPSLGNVSTDTGFYFDETPEARQTVSDFLDFFWSHSAYVAATVAHQKVRGPKHSAPCFSAVFGELAGSTKKQCFFALSASEPEINSSELTTLCASLTHAAKEFEAKAPGYEFYFLPFSSESFRNHVTAINKGVGIETVSRQCAELSYLNAIAKIFYTHGENFKITSVVNCGFFPFALDEGSEFKHPEDLVSDPRKSKHNTGEPLPSKQFYIRTWTCCSYCQKQRTPALAIFHAAQTDREVKEQLSPRRGIGIHTFFERHTLAPVSAAEPKPETVIKVAS